MGSNSSTNFNNSSIANSHISVGRSRAARPAPLFTATLANATGSSVCIYYKNEKINTSEVLHDTTIISTGGSGSIVIEAGKHIQCPVYSNLYVTGFPVEACQPFCCPSKKPLFENVLVEKPAGDTKSWIITASKGLQCAKTGECWVDESGVNHKPKA